MMHWRSLCCTGALTEKHPLCVQACVQVRGVGCGGKTSKLSVCVLSFV